MLGSLVMQEMLGSLVMLEKLEMLGSLVEMKKRKLKQSQGKRLLMGKKMITRLVEKTSLQKKLKVVKERSLVNQLVV